MTYDPAVAPRELWTTADVGRYLVVTQRRVLVLLEERERNGFPEPHAITPDQPATDRSRGRPGIRLWQPNDVVRWAASYERRPGRPRKAS